MANLEQRVDVQHRRCHWGLGVHRNDRHMKWQISIRIAALPATDGSPDTAPDRSWMPLVVTLVHPGYPPVHPCSSEAAVRILSEYFGENTAFSMSFARMPEVLRCFPSVSAAIEEVMNARILGGIHFRTACNDAKLQEKQLATAFCGISASSQWTASGPSGPVPPLRDGPYH